MIPILLAAFVSGGMFYFLRKSRAEYLRLEQLPVREQALAVDVTVVIPARNEAVHIARAVRSFTGLAPVIVVDDNSDDATADIALDCGAVVILPPPPKPGCTGKPNACLAGARASRSEWILFVDADTWYSRRFLSSLLAEARHSSLDLLSVFLRQRCVTFWERVMLPYAFALYFTGVSASRIHSPHARESLANGQCLLFRRQAYEAIGGHAAVAGSVVEDVMLASIAKRHGLRQKVMRAEHLGSVRMYGSFTSIWRGFQKNSFRFLLLNPLVGAQVIAASVLLTSYIPVLVLLLWTGHWAVAMLAACVPAVAFSPWYGGLESVWSPLAIYVFQAIAWSAMIAPLFGHRTLWKGRRV